MPVCLNMIVRNEEQNLERLFASVYRYIDYYVIADTGSEDGTVEMITALGRLYGLKGEIVHHPWKDFASNRQAALEAAILARTENRHNCFHFMFIDADEELVVANRHWVEELDPGMSYLVHRKLGGIVFRHLLLAWIDGDNWGWNGRIHENLLNETPGHQTAFISSVYVRCHALQGYNFRRFGTAGARTANDIALLEQELNGLIPERRNAHRFFQYALALRDAGKIQASLDVFERILNTAEVSGSFRYMSMVESARMKVQSGVEISGAVQLLEVAIHEQAARKEAYYYLAVCKKMQGHVDEALSVAEQGMAVKENAPMGYAYAEEDIGLWKLAYERCFLLFRQARYKEARESVDSLMDVDALPDIEYRFLASLKEKIIAREASGLPGESGNKS